jgi:hypothetical protein
LEIHYKDPDGPGLAFYGANVMPNGLFKISYHHFNNGKEVCIDSVEEKLSGKFFYEKRKNMKQKSYIIRPIINGKLQPRGYLMFRAFLSKL